MNWKYLIVAILILMLSVSYVNTGAHAQSTVVYPTISYHTFTGYNITITDTQWLNVVYPIIYSTNFSTYNWKNSPLKEYLLFDYSLTGLNPYGAEFIEAMETIGNFTIFNVTIAFKQIANLDATGDGYTNQEKLNAGALPGFYNSTPGSFSIPTTRSTYGFIFAGGVIASVIILYFVFNRKKDE
ncbi:MAG: hypothetical protein ACP5MU_05825 [Thermoplasmata archaeon]